MIVFGVPSVGQIRPETFFGKDDHYGFLQTLVGDTNNRTEIKKKCQLYYSKGTDKYWDQIITIINFLSVRNIDNENIIRTNEILDLVSDEFDKGQTRLCEIVFEYFVTNWQFPHPVITKNKRLIKNEIGIVVGNEKSLKPIKPLNSVLKILLYLFDKKPEHAFLTEYEFFHYVVQYYRDDHKCLLINSPEEVANEIIEKRESNNGFSDSQKEYLARKPYLSYPQGFLKNLRILTDDPDLYNLNHKIFIGFNHKKFVRNDIVKYINVSTGFFRSNETESSKIRASYYDYIYDPKKLSSFANEVGFSWKDLDQLEIYANENQNVSSDEIRIQRQLKRLNTLDIQSIQRRRTEQHLLRRHLLNDNEKGHCALCNKEYPIQFLTTAHIKKRSLCDDSEKRDINVVMPACQFGCDKLYEYGYIYVNNGIISFNQKVSVMTKIVGDYISNLKGKRCSYFSTLNEMYFNHHRDNHV